MSKKLISELNPLFWKQINKLKLINFNVYYTIFTKKVWYKKIHFGYPFTLEFRDSNNNLTKIDLYKFNAHQTHKKKKFYNRHNLKKLIMVLLSFFILIKY